LNNSQFLRLVFLVGLRIHFCSDSASLHHRLRCRGGTLNQGECNWFPSKVSFAFLKSISGPNS
jgi:hypothetical protein